MVAVGKVAGNLRKAAIDRRAVGLVADYLADQCQEAMLTGDDIPLGLAFAGNVAWLNPVKRGVQGNLGLDGQVISAGHVCLL